MSVQKALEDTYSNYIIKDWHEFKCPKCKTPFRARRKICYEIEDIEENE